MQKGMFDKALLTPTTPSLSKRDCEAPPLAQNCSPSQPNIQRHSLREKIKLDMQRESVRKQAGTTKSVGRKNQEWVFSETKEQTNVIKKVVSQAVEHEQVSTRVAAETRVKEAKTDKCKEGKLQLAAKTDKKGRKGELGCAEKAAQTKKMTINEL